MLTFFVLLCIPSIQLGASYWVSIATASSVLVLWKWYRPALKAALTNVPLMLVVAFMFLSVFSYPSNDPLQDIMRIAREGLFFFFDDQPHRRTAEFPYEYRCYLTPKAAFCA